MDTPSDSFIRRPTREHRVVVLAGAAVIAHGCTRSTHVGHIWLEPMRDSGEWSAVNFLGNFLDMPGITGGQDS